MFSCIHFPVWPYPPRIMKKLFYTGKLTPPDRYEFQKAGISFSHLCRAGFMTSYTTLTWHQNSAVNVLHHATLTSVWRTLILELNTSYHFWFLWQLLVTLQAKCFSQSLLWTMKLCWNITNLKSKCDINFFSQHFAILIEFWCDLSWMVLVWHTDKWHQMTTIDLQHWLQYACG